MTAKKLLVPFEGLVDLMHPSGERICVSVTGSWWGVIAEEEQSRLQNVLLGMVRDTFTALPKVSDLDQRPRNVFSAFEQRVDAALATQGLKGQIRDFGFRPEASGAPAPAPLPVPEAPAPVAVAAAAFVPPVVAPPAVPTTDQTAFAIPTISEPALPFQRGPAQAPPPAATGPAVQSGETAFVSTIEAPEDVPPVPEDLPNLTVEQYASLCVDRTMSPGAETEVARRYKVLTQEALRALDDRWSRRFQAEGELHQRWQRAYAQYEAWVRAQKR